MPVPRLSKMIRRQKARLSYEEIITQEYAFVGTAERVLEQCIALKRAVDVDEILIIPHYGDIEIWKALRTQELFAREVIPKLRTM